jgi:hypothetical protein
MSLKGPGLPMTPAIRAASLILLLWNPAHLLAADANPYRAVDENALRATKTAEQSVSSLAEYLCKPAKNDREKARAVYRWITDRVCYDYQSFLLKKPGDNSPDGVLKTRQGVCEGYARLYQALCQSAGVETALVTGRVKPLAFLADAQLAGHAWNAVKLDGQWQLVDATWGAGGIKDNQFVKNFKDYFFLVAPDQLIFTHWPADAKWQLLPEPLKEKDFDQQPPVNPQLFRMGVTPAAIRKTIDDKDFRELVITYDYPGNPVTIREAPLQKDLKVGNKYKFRIESTSFRGIVAENGGRRFLFSPRKGKVFEGTVIAPPGSTKIQGIAAGPGGRVMYWTIMEYVGDSQ